MFIAGLEAQSNSARMSTAAANLLGMRTILLLRAEPNLEWQGNLLVDRLLGAEVRFVEISDRATASAEMDQALRDTAEEVRRGRRPYVMNHSDRFAVGSALAYLLCTLEIRRTGGGAGRRADAPVHVLRQQGARRAHPGPQTARARVIARLRSASTMPTTAFQGRSRRRVRRSRCSAGRPTSKSLTPRATTTTWRRPTASRAPADSRRCELAARTEGLILDPIYTAKPWRD